MSAGVGSKSVATRKAPPTREGLGLPHPVAARQTAAKPDGAVARAIAYHQRGSGHGSVSLTALFLRPMWEKVARRAG